MKNDYPEGTYRIVKDLEEIKEGLKKDYGYEDTGVNICEENDIDLIYFIICLKPESPAYGRGIGVFVYGDGNVYQFHYHIHTPRSKGPHRSNQMTSIEQVIMKESHGESFVDYKETAFGRRAFWMRTPKDCLEPDEQALRRLMEQLRSYSRRSNLCQKLKRTDSEHEQWESSRRAKLIMENSTYGITGKTTDETLIFYRQLHKRVWKTAFPFDDYEEEGLPKIQELDVAGIKAELKELLEMGIRLAHIGLSDKDMLERLLYKNKD